MITTHRILPVHLNVMVIIPATVLAGIAMTFLVACLLVALDRDITKASTARIARIADALLLGYLDEVFFGFLRNLHREHPAKSYLIAGTICATAALILAFLVSRM